MLESPSPVQTWLGQNMPTMDIAGSWKVVVPGTIDLPETPIQPGAPSQHAFHYTKVHLKIVNFHPLETTCMGDMCDALGKKYSASTRRVLSTMLGVHINLAHLIYFL